MACKLCLQNKQLRQSHILPEFLYKNENLYDNQHRFLRLSSDPTQPNAMEQKGRREYLLCDDCEKLLNERYEQYAKEVLYDKRHLYSTQLLDAEILSGLDYTKFKLFQLSILWRASVSSLPEFSDAHLGEHEERIRQMLLTSDAGSVYEYGCLMLDPESETGAEHYAIMQPETLDVGGYVAVLFMFGGLLWIYVVSNQLQNFRDNGQFVTPEGKLVIAKDVSGEAKRRMDQAAAEARQVEEQRRRFQESA